MKYILKMLLLLVVLAIGVVAPMMILSAQDWIKEYRWFMCVGVMVSIAYIGTQVLISISKEMK